MGCSFVTTLKQKKGVTMKKFQLITLIGLLFFVITAGAVEYKIDTGHSNVAFKIKHLGISTVSGKFAKFEGTFDYDKKKGVLSNLSQFDR